MTNREFLRSCLGILLWTVSLLGSDQSGYLLPDNSCGPRCIQAILRLDGKAAIGLEEIYNLTGRDPFQPTSLKDLKDVATKMGYTAEGFKPAIKDLSKVRGYLILPIRLPGSPRDGLAHFVLARHVAENYITVVDTKTLQEQVVSLDKLSELWMGYVLVVKKAKGDAASTYDRPSELREGKDESVNEANSVSSKFVGTVESGATLIHTFRIEDGENRVTSAVVLKKSCSCLDAKVFESRGDFFVSLRMIANRAGSQSATVDVSIGPQKKVKQYGLTAFAVDSHVMTPPVVYMEAAKDGSCEQPVNLEYYSGKKGYARLKQIRNGIKGLQVTEVNDAVRDLENGAVAYTFSFLAKFHARESQRPNNDGEQVVLVLDTSNGERQIPLKVITKVLSNEYELVPSEFFCLASRGNPIVKRCTIDFLKQPYPRDIDVICGSRAPFKTKVTRVNLHKYLVTLDLDSEAVQTLPEGTTEYMISIVPRTDASEGTAKIDLPIKILVPRGP
jgi:hypothetical protein